MFQLYGILWYIKRDADYKKILSAHYKKEF
jgi:hypothetical protein